MRSQQERMHRNGSVALGRILFRPEGLEGMRDGCRCLGLLLVAAAGGGGALGGR